LFTTFEMAGIYLLSLWNLRGRRSIPQIWQRRRGILLLLTCKL